MTRLSASGPVDGSVDALIIRLNNDFPGDRGALCPLILNYIKLKPGKYTLYLMVVFCIFELCIEEISKIYVVFYNLLYEKVTHFSWGRMVLMPTFQGIFWNAWPFQITLCVLAYHQNIKM